MSNASEFATANQGYVSGFGNKGSLPLPPGRKVAVVTCMDARIIPSTQLGIQEGDAHVIRNAGGRAADALRSIIISQQLLGTREIVLFHHTDCGMLTFTTPVLQDKLKASHPDSAKLIESLDFQTFPELDQSVRDDVQYLKDHPLVLKETKISGWVYEVETGKIRQVV